MCLKTYHKDLKDILYYISHNLYSPFTDFDLFDEIESTVSNLYTMPYCYGLVYDTYLSHKNYMIFYKIDEENKNILIHRILHAKQNWIDIL